MAHLKYYQNYLVDYKLKQIEQSIHLKIQTKKLILIISYLYKIELNFGRVTGIQNTGINMNFFQVFE
jgi:hypothetical protein